MLRTALETTTMIIVRTKSFWVVNIPLYCYWWMKNNQYVLDFQQECQDTAEVILLCWALLLCFGLKFPLVAVWKKKCWVGKRQHFKMLKKHLTSSMSNYIIITNLKKRGISPLVHSLLEPLFFLSQLQTSVIFTFMDKSLPSLYWWWTKSIILPQDACTKGLHIIYDFKPTNTHVLFEGG